MLCASQDLLGSAVEGSDGPIGEVVDFLFDDHNWAVRWLVVKTGDWLAGRRDVLVSPVSILYGAGPATGLRTSLRREQVRHSPDVDTHKPVSRQHEVEQYGYYGYPYYWGGSGLWGEGPRPDLMMAVYGGSVLPESARRQKAFVAAQAEFHQRRGDDPHLRGGRAVIGYHLRATDGEIGHVASLLIDDETWALRYLVINTSDWWFGHDVLIAPAWIEDISWLDATLSVDLSRGDIQSAPPYTAGSLPTREAQRRLHEHHARPHFWNDADALETDISRV